MAAVKLADGLALEDDWYAVQALDARTFAIGEPSNYQQNWSYLLIGDERALMFDTGSFSQDITGVVARHAFGPVLALPSHMHFDHLGNVERFEQVALADLPMLRACEADGVMRPGEDLFLGSYEGRTAPGFAVAEWLAPDSWIELGGRRVQIVHTPGPSSDSVSLLEPAAARIYAADFLYDGDLYGQTPGADLEAYLAAAEVLLARASGDVTIYGAHGNVDEGGIHAAPCTDRRALENLLCTLVRIREDCANWRPEPEWCVDVDGARHLRISPDAVSAWRGRSNVQ